MKSYRGWLIFFALSIAIWFAWNLQGPVENPDLACYLQKPPSLDQIKPCNLSESDLYILLKNKDPLVTRLIFDSNGQQVFVFTADGREIRVLVVSQLEVLKAAKAAQDAGAHLTWEQGASPPPPPLLIYLAQRLAEPLLWVLIFGGFSYLIMRQYSGPMGMTKTGKTMGTGLNNLGLGKRAEKKNPDKLNVCFEDVAGLDAAKAELGDVVDFLADPGKFTRLGGKPPRGVLLVGPPGNGKTMLAKAIAGEANKLREKAGGEKTATATVWRHWFKAKKRVEEPGAKPVSFFAVPGSSFVKIFAGNGAARVEELFDKALANAPAIIFIDEIDAVGRERGGDNSSDERNQTLLALLDRMDGFDGNEGITVIAATNKPEVLDAALARAGRFDRQVVVSNPDLSARAKIVEKTLKARLPSKENLGADIDPREIARALTGMSSADCVNVVNEAILIATKSGRNQVIMNDFRDATQKVLCGLPNHIVMSDREKRTTAHHEAGHALACLAGEEAGENSQRLKLVTIEPRGRALGLMLSRQERDAYSQTFREASAELVMAMAGRAAELLLWEEPDLVSSGASADIRMATDSARRWVGEFGFGGENLGPVLYNVREPLAEATLRERDLQVRQLVAQCETEAFNLLKRHQAEWRAVSLALLMYETLDRSQVLSICEKVRASLLAAAAEPGIMVRPLSASELLFGKAALPASVAQLSLSDEVVTALIISCMDEADARAQVA